MGSIVEKAKVDREGKAYVEYRAHIRRKGYQSKSKTFRSKREAQRWLRDNEATTTLSRMSTGKSFVDLLDDFVALSGIKYARQSQLEFWRQMFRDRAVTDITPADIAGARLALQRKPVMRGGVETSARLTNSSINRFLAALSAVFSFALEHGVIADHPMKAGKVKKLPENAGRQRTLTADEERRLLDAAAASEWPMMPLFVLMLLTTAARRSEVNGLRWCNVHLDQQAAILPTSKNGQPRVLPLVGGVPDALAGALASRPEGCEFVFYDPRNPKRAKTVDTAWQACRRAAGLEGQGVVLHTMRHTGVTKMVRDGASLAQVARVSGHRTLSQLKRYEHLDTADAVALAERTLANYGVDVTKPEKT